MKALFLNATIIRLIAVVIWFSGGGAIQAEVDLETPAASSVETKIKVDRAPSAVQHTIKQHAGNASVDLFKQFENGRFVYEAQFTKEGILTELKIARDGTILMRREPRIPTVVVPNAKPAGTELPLWRAPALVQETIREQAGTNLVKRFLKQREGSDLVYKADFVREGVPIKITVAETGTLISPSARQQIREAADGKE